MSYDKASLVRQLIPKAYHFDGYSEINCRNSRDKPFFADNVIPMGEHYLTTRLVSPNILSIQFESPCSLGKITFQTYSLSLESFISRLKEAVQNSRDFVHFEILPYYGYIHSYCSTCTNKTDDCKQLWQKRPKKVFAAVSFDFDEMKEALAMYFEITNTQTTVGGKSNMKKRNNFFGMNFELGISKDSNIASTLMGLAVRNPMTGNWYVYDSARNTRKNIANIKVGNFPVMYIPVNQYTIGRLYKEDGQFVFAKSINPEAGTVTLIGGADGIIREKILEESIIPGMTIHTEVVAFDANTLMNPNSNESVANNIMAAMLMMNWSKGNGAEFSLSDINDDSFNGLGAYLPLLIANKGGNLGNMFTNPDGSPNLMMMMALGSNDGNDEGNDMMQMMLLSQLLGNGSSPFSGILPTQTAPTAVATEKKVICEKCGETYPDGTNFCPKCGGKTKPVVKTCHKCGATLMEGAAFCHKCGTKVGENVCPKCGRHVQEDENFCAACGTSLKVPVASPSLETTEVAMPVSPAEVVTSTVVTSEPTAPASES